MKFKVKTATNIPKSPLNSTQKSFLSLKNTPIRKKESVSLKGMNEKSQSTQKTKEYINDLALT